MSWTLVETDAELQSLVARLGQTGAVAVDTEFMRRDTFYPQAGLVQLCFDADADTAWLLDPLAIGDFDPLRQLFDNLAVVKVLHSASEDLEVFSRFLDRQPLPLFDTQRAAALAGMGFGLGYRPLVEQVTGEALAKGETRSDWLARPLGESQLSYAAQDVLPLLRVYRELDRRLRDSDKLEWVFEEGETAVRQAGPQREGWYRKIKSARRLSQEQLAVLAALCDWRESRARELDRPRGWILKDEVCLEIARRKPLSPQALKRVKGVPPKFAHRQGERIAGLVKTTLDAGPAQWPEPLPRPLDSAQRERLKLLRQSAADIAAELGVEPEILLPSGDYELLVRMESGEAVTPPDRWSGWRKDRVIERLRSMHTDQGFPI